MAADDNPPEVSPEFRQALEEMKERFRQDLQTYLDLVKTSIDRILNFVKIAVKAPESADDIFRATVVLIHAYLEDFLRTLGTAFLADADVSVLDDVPLVGSGTKGRAEKFFLGKLAQHRGKMVDDVIRDSVSEHLDRRTFNSVTEIISFLENIGVSPAKGDWGADLEAISQSAQEKCGGMAALDEMIRRRHNIVHRADKTKKGDGLEAIVFDDLDVWRRTTYMFMLVVAQASHSKLHSFEAEVKRLRDKGFKIFEQESASSTARLLLEEPLREPK
jgi:RiboL-PSP-HEPN